MRKLCYWASFLGTGLLLAGIGVRSSAQQPSTKLAAANNGEIVLASAAEVRRTLAPALSTAAKKKKAGKIEIKEDPDIEFVETAKSADLPDLSGRVADDPIEAAYYGIKVWAAACEKADSFDVDKVRQAVYGLEFAAPGGKKKMDPVNQ